MCFSFWAQLGHAVLSTSPLLVALSFSLINLSWIHKWARNRLIFIVLLLLGSSHFNTAVFHIELMMRMRSASRFVNHGPTFLFIVVSTTSWDHIFSLVVVRGKTWCNQLLLLLVPIFAVRILVGWSPRISSNWLFHHARNGVGTHWWRRSRFAAIVCNFLLWKVPPSRKHAVISSSAVITSISSWVASLHTVRSAWKWMESRPCTCSLRCVEPEMLFHQRTRFQGAPGGGYSSHRSIKSLNTDVVSLAISKDQFIDAIHRACPILLSGNDRWLARMSVKGWCFVISPFSWSRALPFHGFAVWLLRLDPFHEFLLSESGICIQIHSSDDCNDIGGRCKEAVLLEEHLEVTLVYVAIAPIIYGVIGLCIVERLVRLHVLLHLLSYPVEGDLLFKQPSQVSFNFGPKEVSSWDWIVRSLGNNGSQILVVAG